MCRISIVKPDDDEHMPPLDNALQLLPGPGHQFTLQEANDFNFSLPTESYYDGFYPMIDSVYLHRTDRPRLTQVSTAVPHREMFHCGSSKADEATSLRPPEWSYTSERFTDLGSPTVAQSCISPASQGFSPLTPLTPLLSMGPSPTNSTFPSPGSQGNPISPSPQVTFAVSLPTVDDPARSLHHYGTSSQYLGGQTSAASYQPSTGNAAYGAANFSRRGHSHSVGGPMRQPAYFLAGPSTSSSPYARPSPKPSVGQLSCNRPRTVTAVDTQSYLYLGQTIPGPVVKQSVYRPISQSDQRRYVNDIKLLDPILFYQRNPQELGINLDDLMKNRLARLEGREEHMFEGQGPSISIRIVWEGYRPWSRQIPTKDFKTPPNPITKERLAIHVARTVNRFINEVTDQAMEANSDARWKIGQKGIGLLDLRLLSLHHVSKGSWQVNLCLNHPLPSSEQI